MASDGRGVGGERNGWRSFGPIALKAAYELGRRSAVRRRAEPPLPQTSTLPPPVRQASTACTAAAIGLLKTLCRLVFQVRAVDEVLVNALFEHRPWRR